MCLLIQLLQKKIDTTIWGIGDSLNIYRIHKKCMYKIEDTSGIIIYSIPELKEERSLYSLIFPEMFFLNDIVKSKAFYFSNNFTSDILELNISNIQKAFTNKPFLKKVKTKFAWYNYDFGDKNKSGQFLINKLY